ncbi:MAG: metallophosphoesterase [Nocardioides sp.]|uniref:metallophosphoesterase n=1 Tax=Nocardioides sp. TaxID=35761 RepID=UPI0039E2FE9F
MTLLLDATRGRVALIGDVGGHAEALGAELARLGVADGGRGPLPDDLVVVQVGDLVHRGPDSEGVVELVDLHLRRQPERWLQLIGNHEAHYLRPPAFRWPERLTRGAARRLRQWRRRGLLHAAVAVRTSEETLLVTHAGLTEPFWRTVLGAPRGAHDAAQRIEELLLRNDDVLFRSGVMLRPGRVEPGAGPLWAAAGSELLPGWLERELPFGQVHGHSSVTDWATGEVRGDPRIAARTVVHVDRKHEITTLDGGRIVGIDPCHGSRPQTRWRAWVAGPASRYGSQA